jgi:transcriptional regulator with XRE-family HTH domain
MALIRMEDFREFVLAWLERRGWSQARLAEATEIAQSLVSKHLAADPRRRVRPSPENLEKYAPVLDVPYDDLLILCGYRPGKAQLDAKSDIEVDIAARTAEFMAAVRGAPEAFWPAIIQANFNLATENARNTAEMLRQQPNDVSPDRVVEESADTVPPTGSIKGYRRRQRPIKPRHLDIRDEALASV